MDYVVLSWDSPKKNTFTATEIREFFTRRPGSRLFHAVRGLQHTSYAAPIAGAVLGVHQWYKNQFFRKRERSRQLNGVSSILGGFEKDRIRRLDHQTAHAYSAYYGFAFGRTKNCLVLTHDGAGDDTCASIHTVVGPDDWCLVSTTPNNQSLANLYGQVTMLLGMKFIEHEYKVMGLAPYADRDGVMRVYDKIFKDLVTVKDDLQLQSKVASGYFYDYLKERLYTRPFKDKTLTYRFDWIAGAVQRLTEEVMVRWTRLAMEKTGMRKVAAGGGIFMNVKANMEVMYKTPLEEFYICPSGGDESTAIGAAYWGYKLWCNENSELFSPKPISDLFLGPSYTEDEIVFAMKERDLSTKYEIDRHGDIEGRLSELIADGKIVARFSGRAEFGARALGGRSILADPSNPDLAKELNEQIKQRDFWMPFAPTIMKDREDDYIVNPKEIDASYMVLAFDTTPLARKEIKAAIHPYDKTCRPQILERSTNEGYYRLVRDFENATGIGAVLNTSFNLHGEPMVCTPEDAIWTFENSGLCHMALENYLVSKK